MLALEGYSAIYLSRGAHPTGRKIFFEGEKSKSSYMYINGVESGTLPYIYAGVLSPQDTISYKIYFIKKRGTKCQQYGKAVKHTKMGSRYSQTQTWEVKTAENTYTGPYTCTEYPHRF